MSDLALFTEITRHIQRYFEDPEAKRKLISDAVDFFFWVSTVGMWLGKNWPKTHVIEGSSDVWVWLLQEIFWLVQKDEEPIKRWLLITGGLEVNSFFAQPIKKSKPTKPNIIFGLIWSQGSTLSNIRIGFLAIFGAVAMQSQGSEYVNFTAWDPHLPGLNGVKFQISWMVWVL